jgi:hypothetical protein
VDKWQATTNLSAYTNAAVDLGENTPGGLGDSNLPDQISSFAANLPAQGTGASASSPLNYVFLVTDGMTDIYDPTGACTSGHCTASLQPSQCSALKAKATVGVIYTTYLPLYNYNNSADGYEINYSELVYPNQYPNNSYPTDAIQNNLTACATSSNYFFPASYGPDIVAAMQSLFATSLQTVRLTQ